MRRRHFQFLKDGGIFALTAQSDDFAQPFRLLVDFLEHESRKASPVFLSDFPLYPMDCNGLLVSFKVKHFHLILSHQSDFPVVEQDDLLGYWQDGV